ncbi:MAG: radical protein [Deltaproteobacteria bacterium]|nr:radical protein [Deltaproteobacteria bacterium]
MSAGLAHNSWKALKALATRRVEIRCDGIPYHFDKVPLNKLLNWILVEASLYVKPERPWGLPTHLQVEPTNRCNLRCAICPVTRGMERSSGDMDLELFKRMIDETAGSVFLMLLWNWGEPFFNPQAFEMIAYARERGIRVVSSTNGHVFAHAENAEKVVKSGLDTLIFAVDGITQESYERYRCGGTLETALDGIRNVVKQKRILRSKTPLVNLRFIVMKDNEHEIPAIKERAGSLGVDALTFKTMNPSFNHGAPLVRDNQCIPENERYRRFVYDENDRRRTPVKNNPCKNLWNCAVIHWSGVICTCCCDPDEKYAVGDLRSDSFPNNWSGELYRRTRRRFRRDWEEIPLCRDCTRAFKRGSVYDETIAEAIFFTPEQGAGTSFHG